MIPFILPAEMLHRIVSEYDVSVRGANPLIERFYQITGFRFKYLENHRVMMFDTEEDLLQFKLTWM